MRSIALHVESTAADCQGCLPGEQTSPCLGGVLERLGPMQCSGPTDEVERVLETLELALGPLTSNLSSALAVVQALRLGLDDVEVVLTVPPHCAGARLSDAAFQALRRTLPNRDIYVTHAQRRGM